MKHVTVKSSLVFKEPIAVKDFLSYMERFDNHIDMIEHTLMTDKLAEQSVIYLSVDDIPITKN